MGLNIMATIGLDGSGFAAGIRQVEHSANHAAQELKNMALTAFGAYGVEQAIHKTAERAKELVTASSRLGVGVEQLQVLRRAAMDSNVELERMEKAFEQIDVAREKALGGDKASLEAFKRLGVDEGALKSTRAGQLFLHQIRNTANSTNPELLAGPMNEIFKKGFGQLLPLLKTDFDDLEKSMRALGSIMDTDTAAKMKQLEDRFELLSNIIVAKLAPAILWAVDGILAGVGKFLRYIDNETRSAVDNTTPDKKGGGGLKRFGQGALGVLAGLGFFANELGDKLGIPGTREKADERFAQAQRLFAAAGLGGGAMDEASDKLVDRGNKGAPRLADIWEEMMKKWREEADAMAEKLNNPGDANFSGLPTDLKHKAGKAEHPYTDSLLRVGNFLGSTANPLERIAHEHTHLLKRIADNTAGHFTRQTFQNHQARVPHL